MAVLHGARIVVFQSDVRLIGSAVQGYPVNIDEEALESKVARQAAELRESGLDVTLDRVLGNTMVGAAHDIADAAQRHGADLIAVGSRGHTRLGGLVLGSVTQRLLHIASCPVIVVPAEVAPITQTT